MQTRKEWFCWSI